jgi:hypothetical protein
MEIPLKSVMVGVQQDVSGNAVSPTVDSYRNSHTLLASSLLILIKLFLNTRLINSNPELNIFLIILLFLPISVVIMLRK